MITWNDDHELRERMTAQRQRDLEGRAISLSKSLLLFAACLCVIIAVLVLVGVLARRAL